MKSGKAILIRVAIFALIVAVFIAFFALGGADQLTLASVQEWAGAGRERLAANPGVAWVGFVLVYIGMAALSLPGATLLTLLGGALFGVVQGTLAVSIASTLGATAAFLGSRWFLRAWVERRFGETVRGVNQGVEREGAFYLLGLRLVPLFPFFVVNLVMGLTRMRTRTYALVSQLGMLPATIVYVNAGTRLSELSSLEGIVSPELLGSFVALGVLPFVMKRVLARLARRRRLARFKKPKRYDYNLVVLGAGSAGLVTSYIAAAVRAKVALIERDQMGGDCLNTGCVPSKALIRVARWVAELKRAQEFGVMGAAGAPATIDLGAVMKRVAHVVAEVAPHDSVERYTSLGVECIRGEARIVSPYEVHVGDRILTTRKIVVATGAEPLLPKIPGLERVEALTSDSVWDLRALPKRLVVLGGGAIGCELAQALARLGSQVTLIERAPRLLAREDESVSQALERALRQAGVEIRCGFEAREFLGSVAGGDARVVITPVGAPVSASAGGSREAIEIGFDRVLLALGRKARVEGFGLQELGVEIGPRGLVEADRFLETNVPGIFVCGDVVGPYQFTHMAGHQAWYAAVNALFGSWKRFAVDYSCVPWVVFTEPEVAHVGLSEAEARARGIEFEVSRFEMHELDRAIAEGETEGFVSVLTRRGSDRVLGATIVGARAGECLGDWILAIRYGLGLGKILATIRPYPTFGEANKMVAGVWRRAHAPERLLGWVARYHAWRRG